MQPNNKLENNGVIHECISLGDEKWEKAEDILREAWRKDYRQVLMDDGVHLFKPNVKLVAADEEPKTFTKLQLMLDWLKDTWWLYDDFKG